MQLSESDLRARLKKHHVKDLRMFLYAMVTSISANPDFTAVEDVLDGRSPDSLIDVVNDALKEEHIHVGFDVHEILSGNSIEILKILSEVDTAVDMVGPNSRIDRMKKDEVVSLMASVLADPALLEGLCCTFPGSNEAVELLMTELECEENYQQLLSDPVFQKRRAYYLRIRSYTIAAVNLYGAIPVSELEDIIWEYEKTWHQREDYVRIGGPYAHTLAFCPRYFTTMTLHDICGNVINDVCMTMEGVIVNDCFRDEFLDEQDDMMQYAREYAKKQGAYSGHPVMLDDDFFESWMERTHASYRSLLRTSMAKPRYIPDQEEFLRYEDPGYVEEGAADRKMKDFVRRRFRRDIQKYASSQEMSLEEAVQELWEDIKFISQDHDENWEDIDVTREIQVIMDELQHFGIIMDGISEANEFLSYLMPVMNGTRLWSNNGHTPSELSNFDTGRGPVHPTVVPMSSHAAKLLDEGKDELEKMGVNVDLDATADETTMFSYPKGLNGPSTQKKKKIYPNDPCPCGSGKKYKYCCGRK